MFSFIIAFFCFVSIINTIQGQSQNQSPSNLNLTLINGTNSNCLINQTQGGSSSSSFINLCLNDDYQYRCTNNNNNNNNGGNGNDNGNGQESNLALVCSLINSNSECHNSFISDNNNNNITLDCVYRSFNSTSIGNQFNVQDEQCMYGVYYGSGSNTNETLLVCAVWVSPIIATTFNNTKIFQQNSRYYKFPLFGFEVNKHFVKSYGIAILVGIIVVSCLVALCCYGLCRLCMRSTNSRKRRSSNSNNNNNNNHHNNNSCDMNRRMPQSNGYNI